MPIDKATGEKVCLNGCGVLQLSKSSNQTFVAHFVPSVFRQEEGGLSVNFQSGYALNIWACPVCRYIELYDDFDLDKIMGEIITNRFPSSHSDGGSSGNSSGGGGDMTDLIRRVTNLEADVKAIQASVSQIQRDVAVSEKTLDHIVGMMATKSDITDMKASMANLESALHKEISAQTWKILSWFVAVIGLVFAIARYIH